MKNWWFLLLNGLIACIFGFILLFNTRETIETVFSFFGAGILVVGLIILTAALINLKKERGAAMLIFQSVLTIGLGIFLMVAPEHSVKIIMILVGIWAIVLGILQLVIMANIRQNLTNKNIFLFNALLTLAIGGVMFLNPMEFAVFLTKIIGFLTLLFGLLLIFLSLIVRKVSQAVRNSENQGQA